MKRRILLVDRCTELREQMDFSFQTVGWQVTSSSSAAEALNILRTECDQQCRFDAIIADVALPDSSATAFLRNIREICRESAVVVVTGTVHAALCTTVTGIEKCTVVEKPVTFGRMVAAIENILEKNKKAGEKHTTPAPGGKKRCSRHKEHVSVSSS